MLLACRFYFSYYCALTRLTQFPDTDQRRVLCTMGIISALADYAPVAEEDVYAPVNYRPPENCVLRIFPEGEREARMYDAVAVQYSVGERQPEGFHVVESPELGGRGVHWVCFQENGWVCVRDGPGSCSCRIFRDEDVKIVGLVFQFIRNLQTGQRWELIDGPAQAYQDENELSRPILIAN